MARPAVAAIGLLLSGATLCVVALWNGRTASTGPPPVVIGPKAVLLRTPDSFGHTAVAFSPDGRTVAAGRMESSGTVVSLCDVASGRERATIKASSVESCAVAFSPDGKLLASGGGGAAKLWDLATESASTIIEAGDGVEVYCVSFSPDGLTLAVGVGSRDFGGSHGEVRLWDLKMGRVRAVLSGRRGKVRSLAFSPDGKALVTGSGEAVVLWDLPKLQDTQNHGLLPCLPAQNGQNGQSSPNEKSSPSSCGQPMFPSLMATDLTPCCSKNSLISRWIFGLVVTSVATQRLMTASEFCDVKTPAAILVVVLSSGP
jgi:WD40 repeat protein